MGIVATNPLTAFAQSKPKVWRIGSLFPGARPPPGKPELSSLFLEALRELGYAEGHDFSAQWFVRK